MPVIQPIKQSLRPPSMEQIEQELGKELIRYTQGRRQFHQLAEFLLNVRHSELVKKSAEIYRRVAPVVYTVIESTLKLSDMAGVVAPQALPHLADALRRATGVTIISLDRFRDQEGAFDYNKLADVFGRVVSGASAMVHSLKQLHESATQAEKIEVDGHKTQLQSQNEFKRQELLRTLNEEPQTLSKIEQMSERSHRAKENIVRA